MPKSPRLVVDTNIIESGLITTGTPPAKVLDSVHTKKVILLISDEVLTEYLRVLEYPHIRKYKKITDEAIGHLTALFINEAERVEVLTEITKSSDPDNNKFLSLAAEGQADYIITARQAVEKLDL